MRHLLTHHHHPPESEPAPEDLLTYVTCPTCGHIQARLVEVAGQEVARAYEQRAELLTENEQLKAALKVALAYIAVLSRHHALHFWQDRDG